MAELKNVNDLVHTLTGPPYMQPKTGYSLMKRTDYRTEECIFRAPTYEACERYLDSVIYVANGTLNISDYDILPLLDNGRFGDGIYDY